MMAGVFMENKPSDGEDVKGFNDSELEDIMNEIENLEKDFVSDSNKEDAPQKVVSEMPSSHGVQQAEKVLPQNDNVVKLGPSPLSQIPSSQTSFDLKVEGKMGVVMSFNIGAHTVLFQVCENGLSIEMQNGVKFTIPLEDIKKSA